ncbi:MAG TPA: cytochrome c [Terriglobales bacterium]|nr:cytochrome c [Terriglobales bacterium]
MNTATFGRPESDRNMMDSPHRRKLRFIIPVAVFLAIAIFAFAIVDASSEAEPSWVEKRLAPSLLRAKLYFSRATKACPFTPTEDDLERGSELYEQRCAICHGATRGKAAPLANSFSPRPPQFVIQPAHGPTWIDAQFIQHGIRWSGMPAFRTLSAADSWRLALYVEGRSTPTEP